MKTVPQVMEKNEEVKEIVYILMIFRLTDNTISELSDSHYERGIERIFFN